MCLKSTVLAQIKLFLFVCLPKILSDTMSRLTWFARQSAKFERVKYDEKRVMWAEIHEREGEAFYRVYYGCHLPFSPHVISAQPAVACWVGKAKRGFFLAAISTQLHLVGVMMASSPLFAASSIQSHKSENGYWCGTFGTIDSRFTFPFLSALFITKNSLHLVKRRVQCPLSHTKHA